MKTKNSVQYAIILAVVLSSFSFKYIKQDQDKWIVPSGAKKMKNPTVADKENLAIGKVLYAKHCKSCHGSKGKGDGPKASELDASCGDFSTAAFQSQTDGELFYKSKEGREDMPSFKKKINDDEDIWFIVNYMRTMGGGE